MLESVGSGPTFSFPPEESPRYPDLFNVPMTPKVIAEQQVRSFLRPQFFFFFLTVKEECCAKFLSPLFEKERIHQQRAGIIFRSRELSDRVICGEATRSFKNYTQPVLIMHFKCRYMPNTTICRGVVVRRMRKGLLR